MSRYLFVLLFSCSLTFSVHAQEALKYRWKFFSIEDTLGHSLPIDSGDYFQLNKDSTFSYVLKAENKTKKQGSWILKNDTLTFNYHSQKDTARYFYIASVNDTSLTLKEGPTRFNFRKNTKKALPLNYDFNKTEISLTSVLRGLLGLAVLVFLTYLMSAKRKKINWPLVVKGLIIQIIFAFGILKINFIRVGFDWLSHGFVRILDFTKEGSEFLFGHLITDTHNLGYIFAFQVLPTVIFFSALTSFLFYYGILQKVVYGFAWFMKRTMKLSGAESLAAAGNIFLGQTEAPLLVKPYIKGMTRSELLCLMSGGMATIAGGVLAAYIGFLGGTDAAQQVFFAKHLLAASVMSAPAAVVAAKILLPETDTINNTMHIEKASIGSNVLEAITNGTIQGLKLAVNVGAMLLVFIAFIAMFNYILEHLIGSALGLNDWVVNLTNGQYDGFSLQFVLGYSLSPLTWLMGVSGHDTILVGQLLGEKTILNEFVAYVSLGDLMHAGKFASQKSVVIATYILCGFANFSSIGIQIGGIGALAPSRRGDLSRLGFRALIGGTVASLFTAVIVGMLI